MQDRPEEIQASYKPLGGGFCCVKQQEKGQKPETIRCC